MKVWVKNFLVSGLVLGIVLTLLGPLNAAEKYPTKPITIIVPWASGGLANVIMHTLEPTLKKEFGTPVVILEKPGSGGAVGWSTLQVEKPDGYTLGVASNSIFGATYQTKGRVDYKQFEPIVGLTQDYFSVTVHVDSPWKKLDEFVNEAKASPGKIRAGSSGTGGIWHICILAFNKAGGVKLTHIPFKGGRKSVTALLGKHIECTFATPGDMTGVLDTGKLRILALGGPERNPFYPDVPTVKEAGVDLVLGNWRGIIAPKGTPKDRIQIIEKVFARAVKDPRYNEFLEKNRLTNDYVGTEGMIKKYFENAEVILGTLKSIEK